MTEKDILLDPVAFQRACWPDLRLYDKQVEILYSLRDNDETIVPAGNGLGKDFVSGLAVLWFFCSRSPCRVVTSSVDHAQLKGVLWGEIRRFIQSSRVPLNIIVNDLMLRQIVGGKVEPRSYAIGRVAAKGEGLLGHHIEVKDDGRPRTLWVCDEASGADQTHYESADTWAHRKLIIGNPYPCENFFKQGVKGGDLLSKKGDRFYRKIIRIKAEDSPNIRLAIAQEKAGKEATNRIIVPGVVNYETYLKRRALWDPIRQCIGLDAEFYEGAEVLLFPPEWLNLAESYAREIYGINREAETMGVDSAEGGDSTVWTIIDRLGIIKQISKKTHDTSVIVGETIALINEFRLKPENVLFDRGGGGKQHADQLRQSGYNVRTVGFGETATSQEKKLIGMGGKKMRKREEDETRYQFKNRRAEMYGLLRYKLLNPLPDKDGNPTQRFGIPAELTELRRQLGPIPLQFDAEGRLYLPPKDKKNKDSEEVTLKELLGCSPDEADSLALAVFGLFNKSKKRILGGF